MIRILLLAFMLQGCATFDNPKQCGIPELVAPEAGQYRILLELLESAQAVTEKCGVKLKAKACAFPAGKKGTTLIIANRHDFDCYMTHEVRHATNGYWHDN